jgi:hypothetical protein
MNESVSQASLYAGLIISLVLYGIKPLLWFIKSRDTNIVMHIGIYLGIFFFSFHYVRINVNSTIKQKIFYITFSVVILGLNTYFLAIELIHSPLIQPDLAADASSDLRPFGPANITQFVSNLLSDALLVSLSNSTSTFRRFMP